MADENFSASELREDQISSDPIELFASWYQLAEKTGIRLPDAVAVATSTPDGKPSARMVLLRGYDERGFVFYTNYTSRKSRELQENPRAALVFYWEVLDRQIRIEGTVERLTDSESDAYFATRHRGSRISAWASPQSQVLPDRRDLEDRVRAILDKYGEEGPVPRPPFWGGWRVVPEMIEFWQSRENRLHDRLRYRQNDGEWIIERLAP